MGCAPALQGVILTRFASLDLRQKIDACSKNLGDIPKRNTR